MKKILDDHIYMISPTITKIITKIVFSLVFVFLWNKYINTKKLFTIFNTPFLFFWVFFLGLAWFNYLKIDGVSNIPKRNKKMHNKKKEKRENRKKNKLHSSKQTVDFIDEEIESRDELNEEEISIVALISNIVVGLLFLIPSIIAAI